MNLATASKRWGRAVDGSTKCSHSGSSSIKFSVIDNETSDSILRGNVERIGQEKRTP
jgi:hypothetical protein